MCRMLRNDSLDIRRVQSYANRRWLIRIKRRVNELISLTDAVIGSNMNRSCANSSNSTKRRISLSKLTKTMAYTSQQATTTKHNNDTDERTPKMWQKWWQQQQATKYHRHTPQQYTIHIHDITRHKPPTRLHNTWQQKETNHGHFQNDKSKQHNPPKPPKTTWRKHTRKRPNKKMNGNFVFDERTYFNAMDQSTPSSDNYKNSEICKH